MSITTKLRITGSIMIVAGYIIVLHFDPFIGAGIHLLANAISLPFFIQERIWDVTGLLSFMSIVSISKLILLL